MQLNVRSLYQGGLNINLWSKLYCNGCIWSEVWFQGFTLKLHQNHTKHSTYQTFSTDQSFGIERCFDFITEKVEITFIGFEE